MCVIAGEEAKVWRAIRWGWIEYRAAKFVRNFAGMTEAAVRIRMLQERIGARRSAFKELNLDWPTVLDR